MDHIYEVKHSHCSIECSFTPRFEMGCANLVPATHHRRQLDSLSSRFCRLIRITHEYFVVSLLRWTFFGPRVFVTIRVEKSHEPLE